MPTQKRFSTCQKVGSMGPWMLAPELGKLIRTNTAIPANSMPIADDELQAPGDRRDGEHIKCHPEEREDAVGRPGDGAESLAAEQVTEGRSCYGDREEERPPVLRSQGGRGQGGSRDREESAKRAGDQEEEQCQAAGVAGRQRSDILHGEMGSLPGGHSPEQRFHRAGHRVPGCGSDDCGRWSIRLPNWHIGPVQVLVTHLAGRGTGRPYCQYVESRTDRPDQAVAQRRGLGCWPDDGDLHAVWARGLPCAGVAHCDPMTKSAGRARAASASRSWPPWSESGRGDGTWPGWTAGSVCPEPIAAPFGSIGAALCTSAPNKTRIAR